jgi:hypothetical protein
MHNILQGTRYIRAEAGGKFKSSGTEASIFGDIDRANINKQLF